MDQNEDRVKLAKAVSRLIGWSYMLAWSASFYPQPFFNWRRKSTQGLAFDFPTINVLGYVCYTISTSALLYSPLIRQQYADRHSTWSEPTVRLNDLAFAAHAILLTSLYYSQFWSKIWGFKAVGAQRLSWPIGGILLGSLAAVFLSVVVVLIKGRDLGRDAHSWAWIDVIYTLGYIKLVVTVVKYMPQAWMNYQRQSTDGWSIGQIFLDFCGGVLSLLQLLIDASFQPDWSGVTGNPIKLGLGNVSIFFDIIFIVQHYVLYPSTGASKADYDGNDDDDDDDDDDFKRVREPLLPT